MQWTEKDYNKMKTGIGKGYAIQEENPKKALNFWWPVWQKINNYNVRNGNRHFYEALDCWHGWDELPLPWMMDLELAIASDDNLSRRIEFGEAMINNYDYESDGQPRRIAYRLAKDYLEVKAFKKADALYENLLNKQGADLIVYRDYAESFVDGSRESVSEERAYSILKKGEEGLKQRTVNSIGAKEFYRFFANVCDKLGKTEEAEKCRAQIPQEEKKKGFFQKLFKR